MQVFILKTIKDVSLFVIYLIGIRSKNLCKILCTLFCRVSLRDPQWNHVDANFQSFPAFVLPLLLCFGDAVYPVGSIHLQLIFIIFISQNPLL